MKNGDIVMVFTDPINLKQPEGQAVLIEKKREFTSVEIWLVSFLDDPNERIYKRIIRKQHELETQTKA